MKWICLAMLLVCSVPVVAQQQPEGTSSRQPPSNQGPQYNPSAPPLNLADLMRANNGSIYRAAMAMPQDPRLVKVEDVSFFNVPTPKPRTLAKHDLVTIIVREDSQSSSEGSTDTKKDATMDSKLEQFPKLDLTNFAFGNAIGTVTPELKMSGNRTFKGEATVDRKDTLTARVQAEVVDVKPNGTLVIQARKRIVTDEEEQLFMLTGVCRVQDILPDNTVQSTQLYDMEVRKTHTGAVTTATRRGWVPRFFDWLNPF